MILFFGCFFSSFLSFSLLVLVFFHSLNVLFIHFISLHACVLLVQVLKPNEELLKMSMWFSERASYSHEPADILTGKGGWADGGVWPAQGGWPYFGMECGQGFLWSLLYGNSKGTDNATAPLVTEAHRTFPDAMPKQASDNSAPRSTSFI